MIEELIKKAQRLAGIKPIDGDAQRGTLGSLIQRFGGTPSAETGRWLVDRKQWVCDLQKLLGFAKPDCDGGDGKMTWTAVINKLGGTLTPVQPTTPPVGVRMVISVDDFEALDSHTKKWLPTLHPVVQPLALAHWKAARAANTPMRITSGIRSYAESDRLYQAHLKGGPQAVPGGYSYHNFDERFGGIAYDFTLWDDVQKKPIWDSVRGGPNYVTVAKAGEKGGLYAGFRFGDEPHMEFHPSWTAGKNSRQILAELRRRHRLNIDPVA